MLTVFLMLVWRLLQHPQARFHTGVTGTRPRAEVSAEHSHPTHMATSSLGSCPTTVALQQRGVLRSGAAIGMNNGLQYLSSFSVSNELITYHTFVLSHFCVLWTQTTNRFKQHNQLVRVHYENAIVLCGIKLTFNRSRLLTAFFYYYSIIYWFRIAKFQKVYYPKSNFHKVLYKK